MPRRSIFVASGHTKIVESLLAYFSETQSIPAVIRAKSDLSALFSARADVVFLQGDWADAKIRTRLAEFKSKQIGLKCFNLGPAPSGGFSWDGTIELPIDEKVFRKVVLSKVEYPNPLKLLIVDDEAEILEVVKDYFEVRTDPPFAVRTAPNGLEAFKLIENDFPHCLILDIKMPVKTGVELYRELIKSGRKIPTIIFIDSTVADDILEIRKWGSPVFVEKGGPSSSMPDMLALVKKLVVFS